MKKAFGFCSHRFAPQDMEDNKVILRTQNSLIKVIHQFLNIKGYTTEREGEVSGLGRGGGHYTHILFL